jgi:hypothetical protein
LVDVPHPAPTAAAGRRSASLQQDTLPSILRNFDSSP